VISDTELIIKWIYTFPSAVVKEVMNLINTNNQEIFCRVDHTL